MDNGWRGGANAFAAGSDPASIRAGTARGRRGFGCPRYARPASFLCAPARVAAATSNLRRQAAC